MGTPLFQSLVSEIGFTAQQGIFYKYKKGWLLPIIPLSEKTKIWIGNVFINSMLVGKFVESTDGIVGYYFTSAFKTIATDSYLLAYLVNKSGSAKTCHKVFSDENLVIVEYDGCGTLAISPACSNSISVILEEQ